jgi:predicted Zn-dependent peptidase
MAPSRPLLPAARPAFRTLATACVAAVLAAAAPPPAAAQAATAPAAERDAAAPAAAPVAEVPVTTFELPNGMRFLLVRRPDLSTVSAGWVAHVGSANERPGITGLAHLFEHMLFKGTETIGTTAAARDLEIIAEQEAVQQKIREHYRQQRERWRRGEIADPFGTEARSPELAELETQLAALVEEQRGLMVKDEFDKIYTEAGASGMNAGTTEDLTFYFITVPANKLELWFWMESDRLANPVFREFYSERDVVHEERRLRTESTPTGKFDELFNAMFWQAHPYGWPVVGWASDLRVIGKDEADAFFRLYYAPNNLTAVLVGNFDAAEVEKQARRYFARLEPSPAAPDVATLEPPQLAELRMRAECDCQPQVRVRYHTVPFRHADSYALDVMQGLLNGQTGRLHKALVLDQQIATSASSVQDSKKYAGYFEVSVEAKGEATPEGLEAAWYRELARLQAEPVPAEELQKVKNQIAADAFRRLENPFFLMLQLLWYDGLGDWTYLQDWAQRTSAVTAEDVQRVAKEYFAAENRTVGSYLRKAGTAAEELPPEVAALPAELRQMVQQQLRQLRQVEDPAQLAQVIAQLEAQAGQVPPEMKPALDAVLAGARARLAELAETAGGGEEAQQDPQQDRQQEEQR